MRIRDWSSDVCSSDLDLCEQPLGPGDYLAIAGLYHTLVLSGVPVLSADKRNEARRFMTLIDALYEHRVKLVVPAAAPPERHYPAGDGALEFQRTVSRLQEMRSADYIAKVNMTRSAEHTSELQ